MSKVLFVNGNVHGHINPTLPVVNELIKRGEEVTYFSTCEFKKKIEAAGALFIDYGNVLTHFLESFKPCGNHPFYTLIEFMLQMDRTIIPVIIEKTAGIEFDYIIHDSMFGGGNVLARKLNKPAICSCTSFAMNRLPLPDRMFEPGFHPQLDNLYRELEDTAKEWGKDTTTIMDIFFKKEELNIVFTSSMFQPEVQSFDDSFKFVGPSIAERKEESDFSLDELEKDTVVYISMGTINNKYPDFYRKCIEAFKKENFKAVMSVGNKTDIASIGEIPDNFIVRNYVPQLEVLKRADIFISHGGLNSVSEALYYGVPVIAIPQANDQPMVTRQITALGAGIGLKMEEVTVEVLRDSARDMLSKSSFRKSSIEIGNSFKKGGGYKVAVDYILDFKKKQCIAN
ncbi:MAG TPA: macrolide family glycosyltransferase [Clostridia bacterium]